MTSHRWFAPIFCVTTVFCAAPRMISIPVDLIGSREADDSESEPKQFAVGETILASIRVYNDGDTTVFVSHYRVRVWAPRSVNDVSPDQLTNTIVPLNPPAQIEPGDRILLDWRFEILPAMARRPGPHRLLITVPELYMIADVEFTAVDIGRFQRATAY